MLTRRSSLPIALSLPLLQSDPNPGGGGNPDPKPDDKPDEVTFDDKQQKKVNDLIAAARKKAEEDTAAKLKADADEAKRKADADRDRQANEAKGEYESAKKSLESERDTIKGERDSLKAENDTLRAHVNADIEAAVKDDAFKPFLRFDPGADAPIADRLKWLADTRASVAELPAKSSPRGNGFNPNPGPTEPVTAESPITKRQIIS